METPQNMGVTLNYWTKPREVPDALIADALKECFGDRVKWTRLDPVTVVVDGVAVPDDAALDRLLRDGDPMEGRAPGEWRELRVEQHKPMRCGYFADLWLTRAELQF